MARQRIDTLMVARGLAESRTSAQAMILAGEVTAGGAAISHPATLLEDSAIIEVRTRSPYVSRGGIKLEAALTEFRVDVSGKVAVDIGSSTGGFTDCLLQRGATKVYAVDVGYGQLDYKLRNDPRVVVMERVNAHHPFSLPERANIAAVDVSFISVEKVIPNVVPNLQPGSLLVVLIKPQFEAGREEVGRGGVVKDPQVHARVLGRVLTWAVNAGFRVAGLLPSPILGPAGNREFFVLLQSARA